MVTELLVGNRVEEGRRLLVALDQNRVPVNAALWLFSSDAGRWKYLIATKIVDSLGPREAYQRVDTILREENIRIPLTDIRVVSARDPLIELLSSAVPTPPDAVQEIPFSDGAINRVFIEDALIYRMSR